MLPKEQGWNPGCRRTAQGVAGGSWWWNCRVAEPMEGWRMTTGQFWEYHLGDKTKTNPLRKWSKTHRRVASDRQGAVSWKSDQEYGQWLPQQAGASPVAWCKRNQTAASQSEQEKEVITANKTNNLVIYKADTMCAGVCAVGLMDCFYPVHQPSPNSPSSFASKGSAPTVVPQGFLLPSALHRAGWFLSVQSLPSSWGPPFQSLSENTTLLPSPTPLFAPFCLWR